jgi:hypothetical protein
MRISAAAPSTSAACPDPDAVPPAGHPSRPRGTYLLVELYAGASKCEMSHDSVIYLIGLAVVMMLVLSMLGLR